ncbi:ClC family H(+)/Cl(-) exchange transporter [Clostridium chauvoei]|uniref:RCK C-terminal domain-containing protein n=2 Tax=Clostridium chauvoei TaxID=46867 RepID=A0A1U6JDN5_9CLOT|nr:ClC family H(+)/Cl(-) exchange transporter [Clostridium chauvoei]ATD55161.1 ClC family H(+)/Cl(-) exchange transporter [Clostridium chauvoei]ATD57166.1 ClC family H(+)/Cl(-) exchange transporter [Clostridium chauvoei]MBX7279500.1 chloride channel protein [Clostridium chauvoei]MBX7281869.1 chloride channel protein [Clostridium chauvoei]MBX7284542.1 chloride channel protein [Clostridium chauvoei]
MSTENTSKVLTGRKNLRFKLIAEGAVIGVIAGLVIVLNRRLAEWGGEKFKGFYTYASGNPFKIAIVFFILCILGYIVGIMVEREPMISGSGIPQVEGILTRKLKANWFKVLFYKFVGGVIALAAGLSIGREGPSVQMGAAIGEGFSKKLKRINIEEKYLITSGASAGLSAAFNAPLSGVMFALEEVHKNFSPLVLLSAMAAALASDFITKQFLGLNTAFEFSTVLVLPLKYYWTLILLGILVGISGVLFNKGILKTQDIYGKAKKLKKRHKVMIPFIMAGIIGLIAPILLGGGHDLIMSLVTSGFTLKVLILFLLIKFIFTFCSFGSGVPGGIFFPLLVLGALIGNIYGLIICNFTNTPALFIVNFIILAMAGHFASIVKAPITGIVLITEMTGSFEHLLPLTIVVMVSYITSDLMKSEGVYESLLEKLLKSKPEEIEEKHETYNKTLLEIGVNMGSIVDGEKIKNIKWPKKALLVAIKRGNREIIPKGETEILSGDYLVVLVSSGEASIILEEINELTI